MQEFNFVLQRNIVSDWINVEIVPNIRGFERFLPSQQSFSWMVVCFCGKVHFKQYKIILFKGKSAIILLFLITYSQNRYY